GPGAPPLLPVNLGVHGVWAKVMFSCTWPPGAHLPLSPAVGRPRLSTACAAAVAAPGLAALPLGAVPPVAAAPPVRAALPAAGAADPWPAAGEELAASGVEALGAPWAV